MTSRNSDQEAARLALDQLPVLVQSLTDGWNNGELGDVRDAYRDIHSCLKTIESVAKDQLWNNIGKR